MTALTTWVLLAGLLAAFIALAIAGWWLLRRRRREASRAELSEELERSVRRLGLTSLWKTPFFEADVFGIDGEINGFDVRTELWGHPGGDCLRSTIRFPRPLKQGLRVRMNRRRWLEQWWQMSPVATGDSAFDERFQVYSHDEDEDRASQVLAPFIRHRFVQLAKDVDDIEVGDRSLYIFVDGGCEAGRIEKTIRDGLTLAVELINRSTEVGPLHTAGHTQYELIAVDALGRDTASDESQSEALPEGTTGFVTSSMSSVGGGEEESVPPPSKSTSLSPSSPTSIIPVPPELASGSSDAEES